MKEIDKLVKNSSPIKTSLEIPAPVLEYIYKEADKNGFSKQKYKYIFKGIATLLPPTFKELVGEETYDAFIKEIREEFKKLAEKDMMKFCDIIRMEFLTREPEDKNIVFIYKLISDSPTTIGKNSLINGLRFKDDYLNQVKHDVFDDEEMKQVYRKSSEMALLFVENLINKPKVKSSKNFNDML